MTETVYQTGLIPVRLQNSAEDRLFADRDSAKEYIEQFAYDEYDLEPGKWDESPLAGADWEMIFAGGDGDERATITERKVHENFNGEP